MYTIPAGFMDSALRELRRELFANLGNGARLPEDYYFTIAAETIWYCYIEWKNHDAAFRDIALSVGDIEAGCRRAGIPYTREGADITIRMPGRMYYFTDTYDFAYGGPADSCGLYRGDSLAFSAMAFSIRAFIKYIRWFDRTVDSARTGILESVDTFCRQFKRAQVAACAMPHILEPGLEDVNYRYGCFSDNDGDFIRLWLYYGDEDQDSPRVVQLTFRCEDLVADPERHRNIIRVIAAERDRYRHYPLWAKEMPMFSDNVPDQSSKKAVGVF